MIDGLFHNTRNAKGGTPLPPRIPRVRKGERKRMNGGDVNYLKSLILHRRFKKIREAICKK